jgi:hypothetical protein
MDHLPAAYRLLECMYKVQAPAHSEVQDLAQVGRELGRCETDCNRAAEQAPDDTRRRAQWTDEWTDGWTDEWAGGRWSRGPLPASSRRGAEGAC